MPIYTGEPVRPAGDMARPAPGVDGMNTKVMTAVGLHVKLSCMVQTPVIAGASAQPDRLEECADSVGNLMTGSGPCVSARVHQGKVSLSRAPGPGVAPGI